MTHPQRSIVCIARDARGQRLAHLLLEALQTAAREISIFHLIEHSHRRTEKLIARIFCDPQQGTGASNERELLFKIKHVKCIQEVVKAFRTECKCTFQRINRTVLAVKKRAQHTQRLDFVYIEPVANRDAQVALERINFEVVAMPLDLCLFHKRITERRRAWLAQIATRTQLWQALFQQLLQVF